MKKYSIRRVLIGLFALLTAGLGSYFGQPLIHTHPEAVELLVTIFSILAGFLLAIISIIGESSGRLPGSWRVAKAERDEARRKLRRHKYLFFIYLITLAIIFVSYLLKDTGGALLVWIERIYVFLGVFGFALSLTLPEALMRLQEDNLDKVIEARKPSALKAAMKKNQK